MASIILVSVLSLLTIGCALCVILQRNPVVCALFLVGCFFGMGGLYLTLHAPFVAAVQILIYAGAITVLFIFVIMLLNLKQDPERFSRHIRRTPRYIALFALLWILYTFIHLTAFPISGDSPDNLFTLRHVAELLFTKYLFPFELASFLLLIALIGGVVLAKKSETPSQ